MSEQRKYFRRVKALADEVHYEMLKRNVEAGSTIHKNIVNLIDMKWQRFCRVNPKANTNAFKEYIQLCQ
jgi:predicted transglutaminase-like cysteine proteinase